MLSIYCIDTMSVCHFANYDTDVIY